MKTIVLRHASGEKQLVYYCPACKDTHVVTTELAPGGSGPRWESTGTPERPTISPSVRVNWSRRDQAPNVCHHFLKSGVIDYCQDSTHSMAGTRVDLPDMPKAEIDFWEGVQRDRTERTVD
jgi:hypothetical protein